MCPDLAAITKYYKPGGLKSRNFLTLLEDGQAKMKFPGDLLSGEGPLPGL